MVVYQLNPSEKRKYTKCVIKKNIDCLFEFDQEVYFILKWILTHESISFEENVEENMVYWKIWYWLFAFVFMNF